MVWVRHLTHLGGIPAHHDRATGLYQTLLIPLDGSDFAEEALPLARLVSKKLGAELHLAHVIRPAYDVDFKTPQEDFEWKEEVWDGAERYLSGHAEEGRSAGVSVLTSVLEGRVTPALQAYADEQDVDLILLTTHGSGGARRWWLGSVADSLLRSAKRDVLLVRPWDDTEDRAPGSSRFERILVALDGSDSAETALASATGLAQRFGSEIRAVTVVPEPLELTSVYGVPGVELRGEGHGVRIEEAERYLAEVVKRYVGERIEARVIESSEASEGVVSAARDWDADLVVLSAHGRGGVARLVLGSVADKIIRQTTRPTLVVHTPH